MHPNLIPIRIIEMIGANINKKANHVHFLCSAVILAPKSNPEKTTFGIASLFILIVVSHSTFLFDFGVRFWMCGVTFDCSELDVAF
jgi:hypothetical protein